MLSRATYARFAVVGTLLQACGGRSTLDTQSASVANGGTSSTAGSGTVGGGGSTALGSGGGTFAPGAGGTAGSSGLTPLALASSVLTDARYNRAYSSSLAALGGAGSGYRFQLLDGALAKGMVLDSDGTLSGTPREIGDFAFTVEVTDSAGARVIAPLTLHVGRSNWVSVSSFPSSASSQTLLSVRCLGDPSSSLVTLETWSAGGAGFSPDGRWISYHHRLDSQTAEVWLTELSSNTMGQAQSLGTLPTPQRCQWSTDSSKLSCTTATVAPQRTVYFDVSQSVPGPQTSIESATGEVTWVGNGAVVFPDASGQLVRMDWNGTAPNTPVPLGVSGQISTLSSSRELGLVNVQNTTIPQFEMVNFATLAHVALPEHEAWSFGSELRAAVAEDTTSEFFSIFYYAFDDVHPTLVDTREAARDDAYEYQTFWWREDKGNWFYEERDGGAVLTSIRTYGVITQTVSGGYKNAGPLYVSAPDGSAFVFGAEDAALPDPQVRTPWLVRIHGDTITQATKLSPALVSSPTYFSPDSTKLLVIGYDTSSTQAVPATLYDLSLPDSMSQWSLELPYNWSSVYWSPDSSYVGFIGGAPTLGRPAYVVDVLAPTLPPRLIHSCSSNPSPLPGCPNGLAFQP